MVDSHGEYIETETLRWAMINFMRFSGAFCKNHDRDQHIGTVVEAITFTKELKEAMGIDIPYEGTLITAFIHDKETWGEIKAGRYKMASIGGRASYDTAEEE